MDFNFLDIGEISPHGSSVGCHGQREDKALSGSGISLATTAKNKDDLAIPDGEVGPPLTGEVNPFDSKWISVLSSLWSFSSR